MILHLQTILQTFKPLTQGERPCYKRKPLPSTQEWYIVTFRGYVKCTMNLSIMQTTQYWPTSSLHCVKIALS